MSTPTKLIQVLLADDHAMFREGFQTLTRKLKPRTFEVVGEAGNGKELLEKAEALSPDVIITDIRMPGMGGIEATILLKKRYPSLPIIALSTFNSPHLVCDMLQAGADGYLLKSAGKEEIALAITTVYNGGTYFCKDAGVQAGKEEFKKEKSAKKPPFSDREREITRLISKEYSNKEIAELLSLSVRSVETYRERIIEKVGAKNFIGVIMYAIKNKLLK